MSSRMFQGVLLQLSEAAQTTIGVIDAEGNVISCSDTTLIGEKWPDAATAVAAMLENPVREEPYTFYALKGWNPAYGYSAFVLGTDAQAEMLVRMTQVSLNSAKAYYEEKHDKGTFVKNIITDNILPGDTILISITRDTEFIIPHGSTILLPWDHILCLTRDDSLHELTEAWGLSDK